ncbi:hypothetical protein BaRGS_00004002 [Batillaria attramentaria]|uniref:Uncharacterized protein n=1 Tax=Batillaria attramentaria TaxID=370345 RepID=A0ABD0LZR0_9CAEN
MDQFQAEQEKLKSAEEYKAAGNKAYADKNYRQAIGKYHRALMYLRGVTHGGKPSFADLMSPNPDKQIPKPILKRMDVLTCECYNNLAACLLATENPKHDKVVEYCERVLELEPGNVKATFRLGTALVQLGNYEKAKVVLTRDKAFATEKQIQNLLVKVEARLKRSEKELEDAYKRLFKTLSSPSEVDEKDSAPFVPTEESQTATNGAEKGDKTVMKTMIQTETESCGDKPEGNQGGKIILVSSINPEGGEDNVAAGEDA